MASNYPPGVSGAEPEISGEDRAADCDHDGATLLSMAEGGFPGQYACGRCGAPFRPTHDLADEEDEIEVEGSTEIEVEGSTELEIDGPYEDLRILEIPLAAHYPAEGLGKLFVDPIERYAILGIPKLGFSADDRKAITAILYALRISKEATE